MEDGRNPGQREASSNGSLEQFNLSQPDEWEDYAQRFELFLEAQGITDAGKKRSTFLSHCGAATFQLAKALVAPDQLKDTPYEDIIAALRNHLSPKPPELARRYEFHRREQATVSLACAVEEATAAEAIDREASQSRLNATAPRTEPVHQGTVAGCGEDLDGLEECVRHIARVCLSQRKRNRRANFKTNGRTDNSRTTPRASTSYCDNLTETAIHDVPQPGTKKIHVAVEIEGVECEMEVDSGSTFSLISEATARQIFPNGRIPKLKQLDVVMKDYQGNWIAVQGMATVTVKFRGFAGPLKLVIVKGQRQILLGLDWFPALGIKGPPVKLALNPEVVPVRLKARRVPFALRQKIDAELDKLLQQGVLEPVDCAEWETPIVTPLKGNGDIRTCADYKCTIHKALQQHAYPVPVVSHVLASLSGGTIFAKLDLAQAYQQLPVTDESAAAQTIVTHRGAFRETRPEMPRAPVHPWEASRNPWSRLHMDFAGPFQGQTFLIVVDSYSKWLEVIPTSSMTSQTVISALQKLFATHGLPDIIVSDNGAQFKSTEFREFLDSNLIRQVTSAPFHPSTNGQAERMVRTTKEGLSCIIQGNWARRLADFTLQQHVTPHTTTGQSPAELLMGRKLSTMLDRLHPDRAPEKSTRLADSPSKPRTFQPEYPVFARNYAQGPLWIPAVISRATGPISYEVTAPDGRVLRRHVDLLPRRTVGPTQTAGAELERPQPERRPMSTSTPEGSSSVPVAPEGSSSAPCGARRTWGAADCCV
ncbi:hypothetical protein MRX96_051690 [Rhipicephalus microplus]